MHGRDAKENSLLQNLNWKTSTWEGNMKIVLKKGDVRLGID